MLEILLAADGRPHNEIAEAAGMHRVRFSQCLHGYKGASFTEAQILALARVLGVHPSLITTRIPRDQVIHLVQQRATAELEVATARALGRWEASAPEAMLSLEAVQVEELARALAEIGVQAKELAEMPAERMVTIWRECQNQEPMQRRSNDLYRATVKAMGRWYTESPAEAAPYREAGISELLSAIAEAGVEPDQLREMSAGEMAELWARYCAKPQPRRGRKPVKKVL